MRPPKFELTPENVLFCLNTLGRQATDGLNQMQGQ